MDKKALKNGCAVILIFGIIAFALGILIGKYWL